MCPENLTPYIRQVDLEKADIYSCGIILANLILAFDFAKYIKDNFEDFKNCIIPIQNTDKYTVDYNGRFWYQHNCNDELKYLITWILWNQDIRPSIKEIEEFKYLKNVEPISKEEVIKYMTEQREAVKKYKKLILKITKDNDKINKNVNNKKGLTKDALVDQLKKLDSTNYDNMIPEWWYHTSEFLNCIYALDSKIEDTFYFIICELVCKYPNVKIIYEEYKYQVEAILEDDKKDESTKELNFEEFINPKIKEFHIYIYFFNYTDPDSPDADDGSVVQFIKDGSMNNFIYKKFYHEFKESLNSDKKGIETGTDSVSFDKLII